MGLCPGMVSNCLLFITMRWPTCALLTLPHLILIAMHLMRWVFCFADEGTGGWGRVKEFM